MRERERQRECYEQSEKAHALRKSELGAFTDLKENSYWINQDPGPLFFYECKK